MMTGVNDSRVTAEVARKKKRNKIERHDVRSVLGLGLGPTGLPRKHGEVFKVVSTFHGKRKSK